MQNYAQQKILKYLQNVCTQNTDYVHLIAFVFMLNIYKLKIFLIKRYLNGPKKSNLYCIHLQFSLNRKKNSLKL